MKLDHKVILDQIDALLVEYEKVDEEKMPYGLKLELKTRITAAVERFAPVGSVYIRDLTPKRDRTINYEGDLLTRAACALKALRVDYAAGYLRSITELIYADIFGDFLEMADYLLSEGFKDPAAVIAGAVLEEHLRKLCDKNSIPTQKASGGPKMADALNAELAGANVYTKLDLKNVTAWLDLRNKAAHGHYAEYTKDQVALLIQSVRDFITRNPA